MKYLLLGYHDNRPTNKYFLLIFVKFFFYITHKNYRCKVSTLKLNGMIALFILNLKNEFSLRWKGPIFGATSGKIGLKMENAPNSRMFRDNISSSLLEYQNLSSYIFLAYNIHLFVQES